MSALPHEPDGTSYSPQRRELLRLVTELPEEQVPDILATVRHEFHEELPPAVAELIGIMDAEPDLSTRYKEILREERS